MTDSDRPDDVQAQWARVRGRLREEYGDAAYRTWLKSMPLYGDEQGKVRIGSIVNTVGCRQIRMGIAKTSAKRKFAAIVQMNRQNFKLKVQ